MNRYWKHLKYPFLYPGIVPRAVENYFRIAVLKQPRLRGVEFAVNYDCQCHCEHCSAALLGRNDRPVMSTERMISALDEMWRLGVMNINLTGGESLLFGDLEQLVRAAHPQSTVVSVATNGMLLDFAKARELRKWGVRIVTFSLDSADAETHDRFRNSPGCYQAVMDATRYCREVGIEPYWCTVMTRENVQNGDLGLLVKMAGERNIFLTINKPCPVGRWSDEEVYLGEAELLLHEKLMKLPHVRWEGHSNFRREGCPAGLEKLYISPYGDVMPCPFIHISYGNLTQDSLETIWRKMLEEGPFNTIRDGCPISSDAKFTEQYIKPIYQQNTHPLPHDKHPASGVKGDS